MKLFLIWILHAGLARIFHTKSITACGKLIITALVSNCDLDSMKHTARHPNPSPALHK
ncbi:MAG: hypothetical protein QE493_07320 [Verrucomicrobiae bacterium]|nr:hypothetical protein [Verrucomicrobiae bacterium]